MKNTAGKKRTAAPRQCQQGAERKDCFARCPKGTCMALAMTDYPCGKCPFYKSAVVQAEEKQMVYARLVRLERMDLIVKYGLQ